MMGNASSSRKASASAKPVTADNSGQAFYERSSSTYHSQSHFDGEQARQRRSLSIAVTVEPSPDRGRKWSDAAPMARRTVELESVGGAGSSHLSVTGTVGRRSRGRSMSARKPNELRPHVELSPKAAGSVRMRRTSDSATQIGQLRLSQAQISMVRKLWQNVRAQGENGAGLQILRDHLFFRYPDIRDVFSVPGRSTPSGMSSETNYHRRLMAHAEALGGLLDEVIANLEQTHLLREKIRDLGKLHSKTRDMGFKAAYWDRLAEALNECTLVWCQKVQRCFDVQVAMTSIVMFIIESLKDGYMEECRKMRRSVYETGNRDREIRENREDRGDPRRSPRHLACD